MIKYFAIKNCKNHNQHDYIHLKRTWNNKNEGNANKIVTNNIDYITKFYYTIIYDNKMYYLYGKINKAVDAHHTPLFVRISYNLLVCISKISRLLSI